MYRLSRIQNAVLAFALITSTLFLSSAISPARAQVTGLVCLALSGTTDCPTSPPTFTGSPGQTISIAVNIQNSESFNGIDISVKTDPALINATSFDTTGNAFLNAGGILFIAAECINNQSVIGNCRSQDAMGVATFAAASNMAVTGGHMFNINYLVTGSGTTTLTYQTGCTNTSNDGFCVQIATPAGTVVPENLQGATFTTVPPQPDFTISASPMSLTIAQGSCDVSSITLTSINGFMGTVNVASASSPAGLITSPNPTSVSLSSGGTSAFTLVICAPSAPVGSYVVTVTGTSGSLSHSTTIAVMVVAPTIALTASPSSRTISRGTSTTFAITVTTNFAGTVNLAASVSPLVRHPPNPNFNPVMVSVTPGTSSTSTLTVSTLKSTPTGTYTVTITGTGDNASGSTSVTVTVTR